MNWKDFDKEQRMKLKLYICVLGLLLLGFLLLGSSLKQEESEPIRDGQGQEKLIHMPVYETYKNVWIMETSDAGITFFREGKEETYKLSAAFGKRDSVSDYREHLADISLKDGSVDDIRIKTQKVSGTVLGADDTCVELEGYGKLPLAKDYRGYRIYGTLGMCHARDLSFGYATADFVMENGEICGILVAKEEAMNQIRVLLKTTGYKDIYHEKIRIVSDCDYLVEYGLAEERQYRSFNAGEELIINADSEYFVGERITITPSLLTGKITLMNISRSQGNPAYRGRIELIKTTEGIVIINQLALEEYLYCVVPSEMPVSYPEEALKAQAICARTYAYGKILSAGYPKYGAHVDDSTSYQVYNNTNEREKSTTAVKDTYGQLLFTPEGGVAQTYYYSTSCGVGGDAQVWKSDAAKEITYLKAKGINRLNVQGDIMQEPLSENQEFERFISTKNIEDYEVAEDWYRWTYQVKKLNVNTLYQKLCSCYEANPYQVLTLKDNTFVSDKIRKFSSVKDIFISKRGVGGYADELMIATNRGTYKVITQHNIRMLLNDGESMVYRQDGSEVASKTLLPSAFFALTPIRENDIVVGYTLMGGGYGHGVGMSQNGAKSMAESGMTAVEILQFFYDKCSVQKVYEERTEIL